MKIAILHYHLHPGGVTRIIGLQVQALSVIGKNAELKILCGNSNNQSRLHGVPVFEDTCLQYSTRRMFETGFEDEAAIIEAFITRHAQNHILHCHNPNLGKNPALTWTIFELARQGYPIVNHCHDFAEDRPENMDRLTAMIRQKGHSAREVLYPNLPNVHFGVLNTCDYKRVLEQGVPAKRVHLLQNPVSLQSEHSKDNPEVRSEIIHALGLNDQKKVITYPIRAIRRKNIGECILLAALFDSSCQFVITQAPKNPEELPAYQRWKDFCEKNKIQIKFEAGDIINHEDLIGISDFCITTSIREGFGMVYLEPWLAGTPVSGRDLPCITADLRNYGLEFSRLYDGIGVQTATGTCDFKDLETGDQEHLILQVLDSSREKEILMRLNPFLAFLFEDVEPDVIRKNRQIILKHFSLTNYGKRLLTLYKNLSW